MEVRQILAELVYHRGPFPRQALADAVDNRDAVIPELLSALERSIKSFADITDRPDYMLHLYAMYLLAQFREPRAYPLIVQFFSIPGSAAIDVTGDVVTEDLCRILASVSCGDDSLIKSLVENENLDEYVREAALRALVTLVACGEKPREEVIGYFHELFSGGIRREFSHVWDGLVSASTDLYPEELYHDIEQCYRDDLVEPFFISLDDAQRALDLGKDEALRQLRSRRSYTLITDTTHEMEWWACFKPPGKPERKPKMKGPKFAKLKLPTIAARQHHEEPVTSHKIGRNEPCPCGSGKKYKKCCLRKDEENRLAVAQAGRVDEIDVLDELSNSVLDLIRSGQLEEAEAVCQRLLTEYPDQVDGLDRLAMVYEAKGDRAKAAEYYRKAADFMRSHGGFDEEGVEWMLSEADRLDAEHEAGLGPIGPRCRG